MRGAPMGCSGLRVQELEQVRGREPAGGRPKGVADREMGGGDEAVPESSCKVQKSWG